MIFKNLKVCKILSTRKSSLKFYLHEVSEFSLCEKNGIAVTALFFFLYHILFKCHVSRISVEATVREQWNYYLPRI